MQSKALLICRQCSRCGHKCCDKVTIALLLCRPVGTSGGDLGAGRLRPGSPAEKMLKVLMHLKVLMQEHNANPARHGFPHTRKPLRAMLLLLLLLLLLCVCVCAVASKGKRLLNCGGSKLDSCEPTC